MESQEFREERRRSGAGRTIAVVVVALVVAVALGVGLARYGGELPVVGPLFGGPDTTTESNVTFEELQDLDQLATTRWIGEVVVTEEAPPGRLQSLADSFGIDTSDFTGESVIVTATGRVEAGINLRELGAQDVQVRDDTVTIDLPESEILSTSLDEDRTGLYDRDRGVFVYRGDDSLIEDARREAVGKIEDSARESGILEQANENAEDSIRAFVETLGFKKVEFE